MNLVSCDKCGVVLDRGKMKFPKDVENPDGSIDTTKAAWNGDNYVPFAPCPVCGEQILADG